MIINDAGYCLYTYHVVILEFAMEIAKCNVSIIEFRFAVASRASRAIGLRETVPDSLRFHGKTRGLRFRCFLQPVK